MNGIIRVNTTQMFSSGDACEFASSVVRHGGSVTLLVSDGIILDLESTISMEDMEKIRVVRILTPYQLENVLMTDSSNAYYIALRGSIIKNWSRECFESIMDIIRIKAYFKGSIIVMNFVGEIGIHSIYLQRAFLERPVLRGNRGLDLWEEPLPQ
ncbi:MAG: hypothetical protein M1454_05040 [Candidatus Thermoplasmatota archaeon]|nr:hypothetical protein [Candidatus Thermoplasmatota archaeon]MCL5731440.1 hypothetical protein [Candidatus Thermoplasmatota archaeon]